MAQMVLGAVGQAVGGDIGRVIGSTLGGMLDRAAINSLTPARQRGPKLEGLRIQSSADGAPMACVFGRARVTGQVIWAARFQERNTERGGGKTGPRTVESAYSLSFAVALCEGEIDGVGRIWADGQPMDLTGVAYRVHRGGPDQTPDPLIEAVEGASPAYRGTAYVVFEDLALGPYGNRPPQLSFEVFRRLEGGVLEEKLEGVCLIPGAGEFILATEPMFRRDGLTKSTVENVHQSKAQTDIAAAIDQLEIAFPNLKRVSLVVGWFGDDLRAGHCRVKPGVEGRDKTTAPQTWSVAGLGRADAHLISTHEGAPAYGGTPSDESVRQAVAALKAKGWEVTLYPFVFMDVAPGNGLPDPYGGTEQAPYPWRGRVKGRDGAEAVSDVAALFGGAGDWGLRRLALHYATLAAETGADGLLIGSEMRGLTWTRDAAGGHPAVEQYRALAAECRAIVGPDVKLSYAADWSEYACHRPEDGSGTVSFHLDPLWADPAIDYVGIDWYAPMGDWRAGEGGVDADLWKGPADPDYLAAQVAGGEGFDWFYAGDEDREAQVRSAVVDTAHGEEWVFRIKDLVGWWSHAHHNRPGGVRQAASTAWVPGMKPIRLTEFGCAAVDRGANSPNLFQDPKSSESALPPYSTGARDDRMQRRAVEAVLTHFDDPANNPVSDVYGRPMLEGADAWCWDARPYPAFPAAKTVWADASAWRCGHWLNGRAGGEGGRLLAAILKRGGLMDDAFEIGPTTAMVAGYVIDRPMRTRDAIEPLLGALAMTGSERGGKVALIGDEPPVATLMLDDLALDDEAAVLVRSRILEAGPDAVRVRFIDETTDYQTGSASVRGDAQGGAGGVDLDLPAVCEARLAQGLASRVLKQAEAMEGLTARLGPVEAMKLETGDPVFVEGRNGAWRIGRLAVDDGVAATLEPVVEGDEVDLTPEWRTPSGPVAPGAPLLILLDLPPLPSSPLDERLLAAVAADPWARMQIWGGASAGALSLRGQALRSATVGRMQAATGAGPVGRWDRTAELVVAVEGEAPESRSELAVLGGAGALAVETAQGWEIIQYRHAALTPGGLWRLSGLLRGQQGTEAEMEVGLVEGATVVFLNDALVRLAGPQAEMNLPLVWRAGPQGGTGFSEVEATARGVWGRPWRPAHLKAVRVEEGLRLRWMARSRLDGDGWGSETVSPDPDFYRVRVFEGETIRRTIEVEAAEVLYSDADQAVDFPGGFGSGARLGVAQASGRLDWGVETIIALSD